MRIIAIGNCQAQELLSYLQHLIQVSLEVHFFPVIEIVGKIKSEQEVFQHVSQADLVLSTILEAKHSYLSNDAVRQMLSHSGSLVTLPYFYNTGFASLIYQPIRNEVFGSEPIEQLREAGADKNHVKEMLAEGNIDFNVVERFLHCMNELAQREQHSTLKLTNYIKECYRTTRLFNSHNHPSKGVYYCLLQQLFELDVISSRSQLSKFWQDMLPPTSTTRKHHSITPSDVLQHGYRYPFDQNWISFGNKIIDLVYSK